jgi:hypothetical protein
MSTPQSHFAQFDGLKPFLPFANLWEEWTKRAASPYGSGDGAIPNPLSAAPWNDYAKAMNSLWAAYGANGRAPTADAAAGNLPGAAPWHDYARAMNALFAHTPWGLAASLTPAAAPRAATTAAAPPATAPTVASPAAAANSGMELGRQAMEYWIDAAQRTVLYWDAMRKRGNLYLEHGLQGKPPLLKFNTELVMDGSSLPRPCNYSLLRIVPDSKCPTDPAKRPVIVVDPRAGHGPGIGGFKADSQVGVALRAGHPVYFISFSPRPVPGQRLTDVGIAEATFIEKVRELHPGDQKKPAVIGNCQAGWAVAALASVRPEIMGPIMLNGAPLSYWAGSRDQNPMRYTGGVYGGSWPSALAADLGGGEFDGAYLVQNFENLNPANTYWRKPYNLYANVDTEEPRFLEFERWWNGYFRLTGEEIEAIVQNLFVGNKLARGELSSLQGKLDLHNIKSPVVVFASFGDNITPPQQALDWIIDVWGDERAIIEAGRTICYLLHEDIGHLGIFVGSAVARKEHDQLVNALDQIELLPPGLYEIMIDRKSGNVSYDALTHGDYTVRFEPRRMDDLRRLEPDGGRRDERVFSTIAKVAALSDAAYDALRPFIRATVWPPLAQAMISVSPGRLERVYASDVNPWMRVVGSIADAVRAARQPVSSDNRFLQLERDNGDAYARLLDGYRDARDYWVSRYVEWLYGPFMLGAVFPPDVADEVRAREHAAKQIEAAKARLAPRIAEGGFPEGLVRALYIALRDHGGITRRSVLLAQMAGRVANELIANGRVPSAEGRQVDWPSVRAEQAALLALFPDAAVEALPKLLSDPRERELAAALVGQIMLKDPESADPRSAMTARAEQILGMQFRSVAESDDLPPELQAIRFMQAA